VTVQNKVAPAEVRSHYERPNESRRPQSFTATALQLRPYKDSPWQLSNEFDF
jgi:hypothetical protein